MWELGVVVFETTTPTNFCFHQIPQKLEFSAISYNVVFSI
jgi:hypothetical protein